MISAVNNLRLREGASNDKLVDIGVSIDGTWQKRGYVSMNGTVALISMDSGKIFDIETMCRFCKPCQQNKDTLSEADFKVWHENHKSSCSANYEGSAPMMEVEGAQRMFNRSIANRSVRYMKYFGDGDSKAYISVKDTYKPDIVKKYECVGHYQKRVGTRLRKLKKTTKGLKCLTDAVIDKLQNYFGMALRANTGGTAQKMADAIWASFLHVASNEQQHYHSLCEQSQTSWCQYQRDRFNKTNLFKHGVGLTKEVIALVKPIYKDLIKLEELEKCLHGMTQNQNESYNALIWERAPKSIYLSIDKMCFAVYDAVAVFNDGRQGSLKLLKNVGINPGYFTTELCSILNARRRMRSSHKWQNDTKKRRKILRSQKKKKSGATKQKEGKCYKAGGF